MALAATSAPSNSARNTTEVVLTVTEASLPLSRIEPSTLNPRKTFSQEAIDELAASIREVGLLQPLVVRPHQDRYVLIAGERRWRACKLAGLRSAPARIIEGADDAIHLRLALVENLQRQDLDPIEEAEGYAQLNRIVGLKQTEIAAAVNRSQPAIANTMRLLELPEPVIELVRQRTLTPAHGKALLKYAKWPRLLDAIAAAAAEHNWPSKVLEAGFKTSWGDEPGIRADWFVQHELLTSIGYDVDIKRLKAAGLTVWGDSPHRAYSPDVDQYATVAKQVEKEKQAEISRLLQQARDEAKAEGTQLVKLEKLSYGSYEDLKYGKPAGCGPSCTCYAKAIGRDGTSIESICTDPKEYRKKKTAETRKQNEGRLRQVANARETLLSIFTLVVESNGDDVPGLALLAADQLWKLKAAARRDVIERHGAGAVTEKDFTSYETRRDNQGKLSTLPASALTRILIESFLLDGLEDWKTYGSKPSSYDWYTQFYREPGSTERAD